MRLKPVRFGVSFGVAWGIGMLLMAWSAWMFQWGVPMVQLFGSVYIGYAPTLMGGAMGFVWGFVDFFLFGLVVALVYNGCKGKRCTCGCTDCKCCGKK